MKDKLRKIKQVLFFIIVIFSLVFISGCSTYTSNSSSNQSLNEIEKLVESLPSENLSKNIMKEELLRKGRVDVNIEVGDKDKFNETINSLSKDEFQLKGTATILEPYVFAGSITKEGLKKLQKNPYVTRILVSFFSVPTSQNSEEVKYDKEILKIFETQEEISVIVRLKDSSGVEINGTKEERRQLSKQQDEWFKPVIIQVISSLSEKEIKYVNPIYEGFGGEITQEGFEKLIKDNRVEAIYLDRPTYINSQNELDIPCLNNTLNDSIEQYSCMGIIYDRGILDALENQTSVEVVVRVKDTSGIVINSTDSIEEQNKKDNKMIELFIIKANEILSTLSKEDFVLKENETPIGDIFAGNITKRGFGKIITNPDVEMVFLNRPMYVH